MFRPEEGLIPFVVLPSSTYLFTVSVEGFYFHLITLRNTTVERIPLDEGSDRRRDLYLTTQKLTREKYPWTRDRPVAETST
jgi:hypothetical protein